MTTGQVPALPPDDVRQLEGEIAVTRERLGDAVEQLVAKLDVKSQARARANRLTGQLTATARRARAQVTARSSQARAQLAGTAEQAQERTAAAAQAAGEPVRQAASAGGTAGRAAASAAQRAARQRQVQLAAGGGLLAALVAVLVRRKR